MKKCLYCGKILNKTLKSYENDTLIITNVPTYKCSKCKEEFYDCEVIDNMINIWSKDLKNIKIDYNDFIQKEGK